MTIRHSVKGELRNCIFVEWPNTELCVSVHNMVDFDAKLFVSLVVLGIVGTLVRLYDALVAKPRRLKSMLNKQGIAGPPRSSFFLGNLPEIKKYLFPTSSAADSDLGFPAGESPAEHNCASILFPFFEKWTRQYGQLFVFSLGNLQILYVNRAEMVREIITCTSLDLGRPSYEGKEYGPLLGKGILTSNGTGWARQRKIIAPELYVDKVKGMINLITESANILVNSWRSMIEAEGGTADIQIDSYVRSFSGDVISRACFGSDFSKGKSIFQKLGSLKEAMSKKLFLLGIPGIRYLPTKSNRKMWELEAEVEALILQVVKKRQEAGYKVDLLQMILEGAQNNDNLSHEAADRFIVDNCKNIYMAGYETTAVSAMWCLMLLAANQDWQNRVRTEVLEVCQGCTTPHYDMLRQMKQLTMVIQEVLRLYPPAAAVSREVYKDMKFGDINVPKGVNIWIMLVTLHTDPDIWGPDAYNFKPDRFANGVIGACKLPHAYIPFGVGPRVCLGLHLAMVELKMLLALILSNFSFSLSPKYRHAPALRMVVEPKFGVDLLVTRLL